MNKLSLDTIRLLSSSQVVTSVSSAVKELVENGLDAGATNLDVKLEKWGLDKIEVRDNGCGIKENDVSFMGQRHYTSKISKHEDLEGLDTYGFRGEALGSLCQVSDVCITTKTTHDAVAVLYTLDHVGKICSKKPTHDGNGTTVVACNIFKNLPVRKQFYGNTKKCKEELKNIEDLLMAYGLLNPELRVTLRNNKSLVWQKNKCCDLKTAMMDVFGIHIFNQLQYIEYVDESLPVTLKCFLPKRDSDSQLTSRSSEDRCFVFVNKRYVVWKEIMQVVKKHCVWRNMESNGGKFPLCFISMYLSSQDIDANLEPNKTKVLIKHKDEVLQILTKKLCELYNVGNGYSTPECTLEINGENDAVESIGIDEGAKENRNVMNIPKVTEALKITNSNYFTGESTKTKNESQKQLPETNGVEVSKKNGIGSTEKSKTTRSDVNGVDRNNTNMGNNIVEINTDDVSNYKETGVTTADNSPHQNNFSCENSTPSLQNGCGETSNDSTLNQNNAKDGCDKEKLLNGTPLLSSPTQQSDLDDLLVDLVDDLDDSTFIIDSAQLNLDEWSKGQGLKDKNGKDIESVKLLMPSVSGSAEKNVNATLLNGKYSSSENGCSESSNHCPLNHNNVKDGCDKEKCFDATPLLANSSQQSDLDDVLGNLVDDLDVLDDSTFTIDPPQSNLDKWSKGQGLNDKNGKDIEPVKLLMPPNVTKTGSEKKENASLLKRKRKHCSDKDAPSPKPSVARKKIKTIAKTSGQPLLTSVLQSQIKKPTTSKEMTKQVSFSLSSLKQLASDKRQSLPPSSDDIKLIKRLDPWGVWLIRKKRELCILNPYRVQELLLYKRLLATYVVPREKLGKAIILDERILGGPLRFFKLEKLIVSEKDSATVKYCDDVRLVSNGFEICARSDPESGKTRLELIKMNTTIPYFGVRDLIEVLDLIKDETTNHSLLPNCRPSKVCDFLKDEVVRITRGLTLRMTEIDVDIILNNMKKELTEDENSCIHNLSFLHPLTSY